MRKLWNWLCEQCLHLRGQCTCEPSLLGWLDEAHHYTVIAMGEGPPSVTITQGHLWNVDDLGRHYILEEIPPPPITRAMTITPEMIQEGLDKLWEGGPIRPDYEAPQ